MAKNVRRRFIFIHEYEEKCKRIWASLRQMILRRNRPRKFFERVVAYVVVGAK
jgi:hypothetical protein